MDIKTEKMPQRIVSEVFAVKCLGDAIGYGNLMSLATALWRKKLADECGKQYISGAFVGVCDFMIAPEHLADIQAELKIYDQIIADVFAEWEE